MQEEGSSLAASLGSSGCSVVQAFQFISLSSFFFLLYYYLLKMTSAQSRTLLLGMDLGSSEFSLSQMLPSSAAP